jgi:hypothetical protein
MSRFEEKAEDGELSRDGKSGGGLETIYAGGMHNLAIDEAGKVCPSITQCKVELMTGPFLGNQR